MPNRLKIIVPLLPLILPPASRWVEQHQAAILADGCPLTSEQLQDARAAGVHHPEKIRLKFVDTIPLPVHPLLHHLGKWTGLISTNTAGITLHFGIYIRNPYRNDRHLLIHECVHVAQYERLGSISAFLRPYLKECLDPRYPWGPLEQEAIHRASQLIDGG